MYTTKQAAQAAGITQPTWRHRVRVLGMAPKARDEFGTKFWTEAQVQVVKTIQPTCRWCGSVYHDRCHLADSPYAADHEAQVAERVAVVPWEERKSNARAI